MVFPRAGHYKMYQDKKNPAAVAAGSICIM